MDQKSTIDPITEKLNWFVERLLVLLSSMAAAGNAEKTATFRSELAVYRKKLAQTASSESLDAASRKCLALCQDFFEQAGSYRLNHNSEYAEIIDVLREAITSLVEERQCDGMVISSAQRFRDLAALQDIKELKAQIEAEVQALEKTIRKRDDLHEKSIRTLSKKVQTLELKLSRTRKQLVETQVENAIDPLTEISNRRYFDQQLDRWVVGCKTSGTFVLAMFDIDDFKKVNDGLGHQVGDKVLHGVAACLRSMVRNEDVISRYGGEEFALLLHNIDSERAEQRCLKILDAIRQQDFDCAVSISCGLTEYVSGDSPDAILQRADTALYQAKKNGKDRVEIRVRPRGPSWLSSMGTLK